mgnify:CR=1 FL=1
MMRSRTEWDWKLKLYPFIVIPWIFYVAAQVSPMVTREDTGQNAGMESRKVDSVTSDQQVVAKPASVTPQTPAFPDRTCFYGRYPLESFCFVLTQDRR